MSDASNKHLSEQLIFDLPVRVAMGRDDFIVAPCNQEAVAAIDHWQNLPHKMFAVYGPQGSGKSHLAQVWRRMSEAVLVTADALTIESVPALSRAQAIIIEDGEALRDEEALFHLFNVAKQDGLALMLTGREAPARWDVSLKDLQSRLTTIFAVGLDQPDEEVLSAVMTKQFRDRGLGIEEDVIAYLMWRIERSFESVMKVVEVLDHESLTHQRPVTRRLASEVLDRLVEDS